MAPPPNTPNPNLQVPVKLARQHIQVALLMKKAFALHQRSKLKEAQAIYEQVLKIQTNHFDALQLLGIIYKKKKEFLKAVNFFNKAIKINPYHADTYSNRGITLEKLNRFDEALDSYDRAISINPDHVDAYSNRGIILDKLNRFDEALDSYDRAISINPDHADAYSNRGIILDELNRFDEALDSYDRAISINPDHADAYCSRGFTLQKLNRFDEALDSYDRAISINPDHTTTHFNLSLLNLLRGNFKDGWKGYEWRWKSIRKDNKRYFSEPLWLGEVSLKDKTILLYAEQGLGDTIQFCRYAPLIAKLGCRVILETPKKLTSLIQQLNGLDELIEEGKLLPSFDYQCPLMSLPHAFKTEVSTIPHSFQYFYPPLDKINQIKQEIEIIKARKKLLIGISWHSIAINTGTSRSIKLKQLIENLALKQVQYINLQYGDTEKEIDEIKNELGIEIFQSSINNYDDMAELSALIDTCDVIISIDNTTAHLAGALGKNTKIMLPFNPDFRWMLDRDDSPWYPSVKLYRQEKYGDWGAVFEKLKVDLEKLVTV